MDTIGRALAAPDWERFRTTRQSAGESLTLYHSGYPSFPCIHLRDTFYTGLICDAPALLRAGALYAAATQGQTVNPLNGEEPGKVLHEDACPDPAARSNRYNACDTTSLYVLALERYLSLTGDIPFLAASLVPLNRALHAYLLPHIGSSGLFQDGPAFHGGDRELELQVTYWKDSRVPGRPGDGQGGIPLFPVTYALAHAQAIAALRAAARLLRLLDAGPEPAEAPLPAMVAALRTMMWDEERGTIAIGLDRQGLISGVSSDSLHLLAFLQPGDLPSAMLSRLVESARALETPLGYRTLDPMLAYQPNTRLSFYHSRTVWPFEQAIIHRAAGVHRAQAEQQGAAALVKELAHVQNVAHRVSARLSLDPGAPETYLLDGPDVSSLTDPAIHATGCTWQLWTVAAQRYFASLP